MQRLSLLVKKAQRSQSLSLIAWNDLHAITRNKIGKSMDAPVWAHSRDDEGWKHLKVMDPWISSVLLDGGQPSG